MSIVDKELARWSAQDPAKLDPSGDAPPIWYMHKDMTQLARELERYCEAMAEAISYEHGGRNYEGECPECEMLSNWQKFKQDHQ